MIDMNLFSAPRVIAVMENGSVPIKTSWRRQEINRAIIRNKFIFSFLSFKNLMLFWAIYWFPGYFGLFLGSRAILGYFWVPGLTVEL